MLDFNIEEIKIRWLVRDWKTMPYNPNNLERAKELRKNMTPPEKKLWHDFLKDHHKKFYRQKLIDNFIVDFYCSKDNLVIEIDWKDHYNKEGLSYYKMRTELLEIYWLKVIRFTNDEILNNFENVCSEINKNLSV